MLEPPCPLVCREFAVGVDHGEESSIERGARGLTGTRSECPRVVSRVKCVSSNS